MHIDDIRKIVARLSYKPGWKIVVQSMQESVEGERSILQESRPYLQVEYDGTGAYGVDWWTSRKWLLSPFMTETEIVHTAFKCIMAAEEHETREQFKYEGIEVCGPHYSVRDLVTLVRLKRIGYDVREDAMQGAQ